MPHFPSWYIKDSDILILVVGQTGTGKSQFINTAAGEDVMEVNHDLMTCPSLQVQHIICTHPTYAHDSEPPFRVVFVDTPGLNGTLTDDSDVLQNIAQWMNTRCNKDMDFGIIYLIEPQQRCLPLFNDLRTNDTIRDITLAVGTKFRNVGTGEPSRDKDYNGTYESAWDIVDHIRDHHCAAKALEIQEFFRTYQPRSREQKIIKFWKFFSSLFYGI